MSRALSESLRWLRRQAFRYLAILAVLLAGAWLLGEYRRVAALETQAQAAQVRVQEARTAAARAQQGATLAERALAGQVAVLQRARDAAGMTLQARELERDAHRAQHWPWAGLHGAEALARSRLLDEQVSALRQAHRLAQEQLDAALALQRTADGLSQLQEEALAKRAEADRLRLEWRRLSAGHPLAQRFPWTAPARELDALKERVERLQQEAVRSETAIASAARSREVAQWLQQRAALHARQAALRQAEAAHAALVQARQQSRYVRMESTVRAFLADKARYFGLALAILAAAIASRLLVKLLLYYVVAPFAGRRAPVRLSGPFEPRAFAQAGMRGRSGKVSAESIAVRLREGEELLVRPEFLQSTPEQAAKRTAWLLNAALPFTSLLSGLYLLTRVHADPDRELVLSAMDDPLDELCEIVLPAGAALVCQPRALAGVVQLRGAPLRVTRHWRLASLHAWLTLQLRYLVFHGPGRLLVKGRRGVRMEPAGGGRLVRQAATLGFDASVPYSNARTETFVPYWLGKAELFNDRFGGIDGSYFYEERPLDRRGNAVVGRGLEGLADGVLRVFGI